MIILTLRTDKPVAEAGVYEDNKQLAYIKWQAHRELSSTIHKKMKKVLGYAGISPKELQGIVCYKGPGSFTGLRIGLSVANALAYALKIPTTAKSGENWLQSGIMSLKEGGDEKIVAPKYDSPPKVTKARK